MLKVWEEGFAYPLQAQWLLLYSKSIPNPSSHQTILTNTSSGIKLRQRMFMQRDVGVAGFIDHVNLLAYCACPLTIEHHQAYRRTKLKPRRRRLERRPKGVVLGSLGLMLSWEEHDAI